MIFISIVALATALGTWVLGWWAVAIVALFAGALHRAENGRPWRVALACLTGWALLMLFDAAVGPFGSVAKTVAGAMSIPSAALLIVTLLFPALIGWSGATLGALGGPSPLRREGGRVFDGTSREELPKGTPASL
jgi:hypothetical protein